MSRPSRLQSARSALKDHTRALDAFVSRGAGPIGELRDGHLKIRRRPARRVHIDGPAIETRVSLVRLVAGDDGRLVRAAADAGSRGIVIETFGAGNVPEAVMSEVAEVRGRNVALVFASRSRAGDLELSDGARSLGVLDSRGLDGLKARVLLAAGLGQGCDASGIQHWFDQLAG